MSFLANAMRPGTQSKTMDLVDTTVAYKILSNLSRRSFNEAGKEKYPGPREIYFSLQPLLSAIL